MKFECINYYLLARFMYRLCIDQVPSLFKPFFQRNQELHKYSTRIADHFHIPLVKSDLGKTGIRFRGAVFWNSILNDGINHEVSEAVFKKFLKKWLQIVKIWSHKFLILGMGMQQIPKLFGNRSWCSMVPFCLIFFAYDSTSCNRLGALKPSRVSCSLCCTSYFMVHCLCAYYSSDVFLLICQSFCVL